MSKILIDTNLLVYLKDSESVYHHASLKIMEQEDKLFVTTKNLVEYFAVVTKGENPLLNPGDALLDIEEFISMAKVLFPNSASLDKLKQLITSYSPKGLRVHDLEIVAIALTHGIERIATFNTRDFSNIREVELVTPT